MRSAGSIPILPVALILAIALIAVSLGGYFIYSNNTQKPAGAESLIVQTGDTVSVDYVGMFQDGRVFDTSIESVAINDAAYPKSLTYTRRDAYSPMNFTVGSGQMIKGFDSGVVDMYVGETKEIVVSPVDGYGAADSKLILTRQLIEEVPVYTHGMKLQDFTDNYSISPSVGVTVKNNYWGWNTTVYSIDTEAGTVTLKDLPDVGMIVKPYMIWNCEVLSIDESANNGLGKITVRNLLNAADANKVTGEDILGSFRVIAVDPVAGTYTSDYNREVVGQTLVFRVTIISMMKTNS
ncbi:MAG: FKBP-type peptidyl-prolyl cis-trans isomerase [Methanobacteriota archaeon]